MERDLSTEAASIAARLDAQPRSTADVATHTGAAATDNEYGDNADASATVRSTASIAEASPPNTPKRASVISPSSGNTAYVVRLSDVKPEAVRFLWPGRIPLGKVTLFVGHPGVGKSYVTADLTARVTAIGVWPDGSRAPLGNVVWLSAEDGISDTIRPRVDRLGGDAGRVVLLEAVKSKDATQERGFTLADIDLLEETIRRASAKLVIVDPLSAYMGQVDTWKDSDVRSRLRPLSEVAERTGVAIVVVMHLTKASDRSAINRVSGSIGFVGAARAAYMVVKDPDDSDGSRRLILTVKVNFGREPLGIAFSIDDAGALTWDTDPVTMSADQALRQPAVDQEPVKTKTAEIMGWLRAFLKDGPVPSDVIHKAADNAGYKWRTVEDAKTRLGIKAASKAEGYAWSLPTPPDGSRLSPEVQALLHGEPCGPVDLKVTR
jgi:putative DNA primase/helicase